MDSTVENRHRSVSTMNLAQIQWNQSQGSNNLKSNSLWLLGWVPLDIIAPLKEPITLQDAKSRLRVALIRVELPWVAKVTCLLLNLSLFLTHVGPHMHPRLQQQWVPKIVVIKVTGWGKRATLLLARTRLWLLVWLVQVGCKAQDTLSTRVWVLGAAKIKAWRRKHP